MRSPTVRILAGGAVLAAIVVAVLMTRDEPRPSLPQSRRRIVAGPGVPTACVSLPERAPTPSWLPASLPLPRGSYAAAQEFPSTGVVNRAIFAVKGSLQEFVRHVTSTWRSRWTLGAQDAEPGEAESTFFNEREGLTIAFIARSSYCDTGWTWLYLAMGRVEPAPT